MTNAEFEAWRSELPAAEQLIALTAARLEARLVRGREFGEGAYHLAFFMTRYLAERGVAVKPVLGWASHPDWKGLVPHAWIEYGGRKTDPSLTHTLSHDLPLGALIILDRVIRPGETAYRYHQLDDQSAFAAFEWMASRTEHAQQFERLMRDHAEMQDVATDPAKIDDYLRGAPDGLKYQDLVDLVA